MPILTCSSTKDNTEDPQTPTLSFWSHRAHGLKAQVPKTLGWGIESQRCLIAELILARPGSGSRDEVTSRDEGSTNGGVWLGVLV